MVGLYCTPSYIHNRKAKEVDLPRSLKGVDMAFFTTCKALGLKVFVRPVKDPRATEWLDSDGDESEDHSEGNDGYYDRRRFQLNKDGKPAPDDYVLKYDYGCSDWRTKKKGKCSHSCCSAPVVANGTIANNFSERLARIKRERQIVGLEE